MIPAKTQYKIYNAELLVIIKAFQIWRHYLEGCKHAVLVLANHNNLRWVMDTKSLSFRQVRWAQELSRYYFRIDYYQSKANGASDGLSCFSQRKQGKEDKFKLENAQIFYKLQSSLTSASFSGFNPSTKLLLLHRVFIWAPHVLPQLRQFWDTFQTELANEKSYKASIGGIRLRLSKL